VKTDDRAFVPAGGGSSLVAAASSGVATDATLTQSELDAIATVAISQWTDALGDGDARLAALGDVRIAIADLAGSELGYTEGNTIVIDADAADNGWFVDVSPASSTEFRVRLDRNIFAATPDSGAYGHMDLVTVVAHELGHLLGFDHGDAGAMPVMVEDLDPGVRYGLASGAGAGGTKPVQVQLAAAPAVQSASGVLAFDLDALMKGAMGSNASIDWNSAGFGSLGVELSPYAPPKPAKYASLNLADFVMKPAKGAAQEAGFDSMGRALLGEQGKSGR
jgi:hypothetical protein